MKLIKEASAKKIELLNKLASKQAEIIRILKDGEGKDEKKVEVELERLNQKIDKLLGSNHILLGLVKLDYSLDALEKKASKCSRAISEASRSIQSGNGSQAVNKEKKKGTYRFD